MRKLNSYHKVALFCAGVLVSLTLAQFVFVILPVSSLANAVTVDADYTLDRITIPLSIFNITMLLVLVAMFGTALSGRHARIKKAKRAQ